VDRRAWIPRFMLFSPLSQASGHCLIGANIS
jgi:hypothetical protein